ICTNMIFVITTKYVFKIIIGPMGNYNKEATLEGAAATQPSIGTTSDSVVSTIIFEYDA
ncbi:hypothetical protein ACJX0J_021675, partial [Zea mays]